MRLGVSQAFEGIGSSLWAWGLRGNPEESWELLGYQRRLTESRGILRKLAETNGSEETALPVLCTHRSSSEGAVADL